MTLAVDSGTTLVNGLAPSKKPSRIGVADKSWKLGTEIACQLGNSDK